MTVPSRRGTRGASPVVSTSQDRTTLIGISALIVALIILIILIALITLLPAQTIAQTLTVQASDQQKTLAGSLARQAEGYLNNIAYDLLSLSSSPEIKASANTSRPSAMATIKNVAQERIGFITAIVRLDATGKPLYAWPDAYNQKITAGQALPWSVDQNWVDNLAQVGDVQYFEQPTTDGVTAYLMAAPINQATPVNEAIVIQFDVTYIWQSTFNSLSLSNSGQVWVFSGAGKEQYHFRDQPAFTGDASKLPVTDQPVVLAGFPSADRESAAATVYATFARNRSGQRLFSIVLSHATDEAQAQIISTTRSFFLFGLGIIALIVVFGLIIARYLLGQANRHRQEEQRRSTARTLLATSRALNSSLDLSVVLERILGELGGILPHDSASILLLNEDQTTVAFTAETGDDSFGKIGDRSAVPLSDLRGAREVVVTGKPVVINDCATDPRWKEIPGSKIQSWLGVPLRVRDESVGILNIDSHSANRFLPDDIDLAEAFADQAGVAIQNARAHEVQINAYEADLTIARAIQSSLLPQDEPPVPQIQLASRWIAAKQVSGDYYQYYMLPDGKLGVAVGDVSGKGIPAALLMAVITTTLRDEILRTPSPGALLNELNKRLVEHMKQNNMNSALLMSIFDPTTRHVEIANGGMVQPYVRNGKGWESVDVGGYPLGAALKSDYKSKVLTLAPGSMLVIVSDGVVESQNPQREFFGFDRLEALLAALPITVSADDVADAIAIAVSRHLEGHDPQDDTTIVVMKSVEL